MAFTFPPVFMTGGFVYIRYNAQRLKVFVYKVYKFVF